MNHFTVELVSNASQDRFADNSTTSFTSYLAQPIKLEGKWKFALTKISVPTHFNNVSKSRIRIKPNAFLWYSKGWDRYVICDIEVFFGTAQDVIEKINECVREALKADWDRSIAEAKKKAVENMTWEESIEKAKERNAGNVEVDEEPPVDLDQDFLHSVEIDVDGNLRFKLDDNFMIMFEKSELASALGVDVAYYHKGDVRGTITPDIQRIHTIYVYSDAVDYSIVGDTRTQMLTYFVIPNMIRGQSVSKRPMIHEKELYNPVFRPLISNYIQSIKIDLRDAYGEKIQFYDYGQCNATLKFIKITD